MKINHTVTQYAIGGVALALASFGVLHQPAPVHEASVHVVQRASKFDWPALGQDKTIALGEALEGVRPAKIMVYCQASTCHELALDLDDAFQIAGWVDALESSQVESQEDQGIFVGPPGPEAENFVAILKKTTGIDAKIVGITGIEGIGIIIGKTGAAQ